MRTLVPALVAACVVVAGCGAAKAPPDDREWLANARDLVTQLRSDVLNVSGFDRIGPARMGLRDESQLYGLLVAYTDLAGCTHMAAALGAAPPHRLRAVRLLGRACVHLRRADQLFTRAVARSAPALLAAASREALVAMPALDAAALNLARPA